MKGNANLSTVKATYFPPSMQPLFMGAHVPVKSGYGSLSDQPGNISYFHNYRNENLAKFQMPPYDWGQMSTQYSPKPDIVAANRVKNEPLTDAKIDYITLIDPFRQSEIDNFYQACQRHRDQYKDHSGILHSLDYFENSEFPYQCPSDPTSTYLKFPTCYTQYRHPLVFPRTLERTSRFPNLPERTLYGRYAAHSQ